MDKNSLVSIIAFSVFFGFIFSLILIAYSDNYFIKLFQKYRCRIGKHKNQYKIGKYVRNKYYCEHCKEPRKHPELKLIDGGKKIGNNKFRF